MATTVGIVGGTGPLGRGLAGRWAAAGVPVTIGSRDPQRAADAVADVRQRFDAADGAVAAGGHDAGSLLSASANLDAVDADVVVLAVPYSALEPTLEELRQPLAGRVVVSTINPLGFDEDGPHPVQVDDGAVAVSCATRLPESRVVAAFHSVAVRSLLRFGTPMDDDVGIFSDDEEAMALVTGLADRIDGVRGVPAGPLRLAGPMEALTAVIISINRRHGSNVGVRFTRLDV